MGESKRVSWVELYLDLVFVLAVGQLAHLIVGDPEMRSVWIALGLFVTLWWTWVGFAVLYNRHGADEPLQRLLFLAGSVPAGVAAVAIDPAAGGDMWWLYFDSAAELNLRVLELSGGSPTMARAIFATGHMLPAFALLITAAGVGLLLEGEPPRIAYWLACVGIGLYLAGTRVFLTATARVPGIVRALLLLATFQLARIGPELGAHGYVWLLTGWVTILALLSTRTAHGDEDEALGRFLGRRRD